MKICNTDAEFASFIAKLQKAGFGGGTILSEKKNLDLLDYHWFLISIMEGLKEKLTLDIMDNSDYSFEQYKILEGSINHDKPNEVYLKLERLDDKKIIERVFKVDKVDDTRENDFRRYYVYTTDGDYRFTIKK